MTRAKINCQAHSPGGLSMLRCVLIFPGWNKGSKTMDFFTGLEAKYTVLAQVDVLMVYANKYETCNRTRNGADVYSSFRASDWR
jgi:hypothetical protein